MDQMQTTAFIRRFFHKHVYTSPAYQVLSKFPQMFFGGSTQYWSFSADQIRKHDDWQKGPNSELATLGAGCYWGTEKYFAHDFEGKHPGAILGTSVGFMNFEDNAPPDPTYREVCEGDTGYVEVLHMMFDNKVVSYEDVIRHFYTFHDPTTYFKQGQDVGSQYASVIFYHS